MEIIPIGNKKIKISLTKNDLEKYMLDLSDMDYKSTGTRKAFWSILDDVNKESGFDAAKNRIFVQVFTSPAGGCEMFVTSVAEECDDPITCVCDPLSGTYPATYRFEGIEGLLGACRALIGIGYSAESRAFYIGDNYYLSITAPRKDGSAFLDYGDILTDFGENIGKDEGALIAEHGVCFCRNDAVTKLSKV